MSTQTTTDNQVASLKSDKLQIKSESLYTKAFRRILRDRMTMSMLFVLFLLVVFSLSAPLIESAFGVSYTRTNIPNAYQPAGTMPHILGTDDLGRDQLARLAYAGQISLSIAFGAAILSLSIGLALGIITGYYGGIIDDITIWAITTLNSIPTLLLLIIVVAIFRPRPEILVLVLGLLGWTGTARLVRGETFGLREREYIISARALGASDLRIMWSHIAPNLLSIVVITLAMDIGSVMLAEAALSYLGLGVQPPTPSWGNMLSNAQTFFTRGPHLVVVPGVIITVTVLCLYVIGDGIRDAFDPVLND